MGELVKAKKYSDRRFLGLVISFSALFIGVLIIKISDYDLWWHLALGREMLSQGSVFLPDSFSYTFDGVAQYNGEWLADLLMYSSFSSFGLGGVYLFKFVIMSLVFSVIYQTCRLYADTNDYREIALVFLSLIVILFAIRFRLFIRPYLFSYLCFAYFLFALSRGQMDKPAYWFWLLIPVEVLWANTSKGAFMGVLLVGLYCFDRLVSRRLCKADVTLLFCVPLASLLNPEGWRIYGLLFGFVTGDSSLFLTSEQQPLSTQILWGAGWAYTFCYQVLVVTGIIYFGLLKGWRNIFHLLVFVFFLVFSIALIRMIDFFAIFAGLLFFLTCKRLLQFFPYSRSESQLVWPASVSILAVFLLAIFVPGNKTYEFGVGVKSDIFPVKAVEFLRAHEIRGQLFNSYPFGGYLAFFHPEVKVFTDGRGYQLYPYEFQEDYFRSIAEADVWARLEERWGFELAVLEYDRLSMGRHFARHLARNPDWALVFWDEKSVVYLKRESKYLDTINRHQYRIARPDFYNFDYLQAASHTHDPIDILAWLTEDVERDPDNQEIRLARAFYLFNHDPRFYKDEILTDLEACLELEPDLAMEHSARGFILFQSRDLHGAKLEANAALRLDPDDLGGKYLLGKLGSETIN